MTEYPHCLRNRAKFPQVADGRLAVGGFVAGFGARMSNGYIEAMGRE